MRVRSASGVRQRLVLCAYAIAVTGERRLLESEHEVAAVLTPNAPPP
jgi:hypothetical protein